MYSIMKLFIFLLTLFLVSCNSSKSGKNNSTGGTTIASQFIDSPVKGLDVDGSVSGRSQTGSNGKFSCISGEIITFRLRDLLIGSSNCGEKIYLDEVALSENADRIASVLQSLSTTSPDSGLIDLSQIPSQTSLIALDLSSDNATISSINALKLLMNVSRSYIGLDPIQFASTVTPADAREHLNNNLPRVGYRAREVLNQLDSDEPLLHFKKTSGAASCHDFMSAKLNVTTSGSQFIVSLKDVIFSGGGVSEPISGKCPKKIFPTGYCNEDYLQISGIRKSLVGDKVSFTSIIEKVISVNTSELIDVGGDVIPPGSTTTAYTDLSSSRSSWYQSTVYIWNEEIAPVSEVNSELQETLHDEFVIKISFGGEKDLVGEAEFKLEENYLSSYESPGLFEIEKEELVCKYNIEIAPTEETSIDFSQVESSIVSKYKNDSSTHSLQVNVENPKNETFHIEWEHTYNGSLINEVVENPLIFSFIPSSFNYGTHSVRAVLRSARNTFTDSASFDVTISNPFPYILSDTINPQEYITILTAQDSEKLFSFSVSSNNVSLSGYKTEWRIYKAGMLVSSVDENYTNISSGIANSQYSFVPSSMGSGEFIVKASLVSGGSAVGERQWAVRVDP
jgi:hypothetical protein